MELVGKIIVAILCFGALAVVWSFITGAMSKHLNANIQYRGKTVATPDQFDNDIEAMKKFKNDTVKKLRDAISKFSSSPLGGVDKKMQLLKELEDLKSTKIVSDDEYDSLRKEIMT